jgi:hypothetical protein
MEEGGVKRSIGEYLVRWDVIVGELGDVMLPDSVRISLSFYKCNYPAKVRPS